MDDDKKPRAHIRNDNAPFTTLCGAVGESMSRYHYVEHVIPNRDGCCSTLWRRLCPECVRRT